MQLPGLDELESSVARAVEEIARLKAENAAFRGRIQALGKDVDDLAVLMEGMGSDHKIDAKTKKRMSQRLKSMVDHVG